MGPISRDIKSKIIRRDGVRMVIIPEEFFLVGEEVSILQDRDGSIAIQPAEEGAREEMWARFNPFVEWKDGT